ncbi:unnamed protein product [Mesocestoides corti]|uniref:Importin N-terminal domain-containing protein n=1 Tax=Mesocestoides corti TaxID=53468 RepID=A0A0R3UNJ2_MESCO|nr:unnamed protein product [Mesocestoides corti]
MSRRRRHVEVDLVAILNSASSGDSTSLHSAASTIDTLLTDDPFLLTELCKCLFSPQPSLLPGGCLLGLVYLKNAVSSSSSWSQIGRPQQIGLKVALINHLQTNPPPNRLLAEIFSSVFRHEWCSDRWPEDLWNAALLSECRLPLRLCIKRAAALRLSARRREVAAHVAAILPQFISVWFATDVAEALRLTYTCITSLDQSTSREILSIQAALTERLIHHALSRLVCLNNPQDKWIAKLLHALFCILPTGLRSANALYTFKVLANVVWSTQLDPKAITWTLALMCNLLSAASSKDPCDDSSRFPSLHPEARQQIHEWLVSESGGNLYPSNAFKILSALMINWLPLKPAQVDALFTDPESSYSCGGVGCDEESLFAVEVWDSDGVIPSAHFISIGCDPQPHLRQTAEAVYHLVVGHLGKHASLLNTLRTSLQTYHANNEDPMAKELALRCAQLAMCDFEPAHAAKLAETIDGFVALDSTSSPVNTCASLALYCRQLVLLVRRAVYVTEEQPSDNSEGVLRDRCTLALWRIIPFLGFACDSKVHSLGVRLAAAHCLHWLMEHHNFQPDSLLSVLPKVSEALGSLAQDVRDSETRILIVGHVRSVLVNASIEEHPDLFMHVIDLLDRLWQVGSVSTAVRATILDLIAYLMCGLNASPESVPVCNPTGLAARLRDKVVEVVAIDLMRFVRTGEIGVDVDRDVDASVLVEPCLDLWHALVAGPGAAWSPALDHLMPVLTGDFEAVIGQPPPSPRKSLYGKIETTTQAVVRFW